MQLTIINSRLLALIAQTRERWPLAGDQLAVDLDLSLENLPAGTRLALGAAIFEVTSQPHTGCGKFTARFGLAARQWVGSAVGMQLRLRGLNAKVVRGGEIHVGDMVRKV
jgi:MOSC domain-containing protein YiiM